jgi:hypothetical protein
MTKYTHSDLQSWGERELIEEVLRLQTIVNMKRSIRIPVSCSDAQELEGGESFNWTFPVIGFENDEWIDVELVGEEFEDDEELEDEE